MTCFRMPNGETLWYFCKKNKYRYSSLYRYVDNGMSVEESIEHYKNRKGRKDLSAKYFYNGQKLTDIFAYDRNKYYSVIRLMREKHFSLNEAVERVLK